MTVGSAVLPALREVHYATMDDFLSLAPEAAQLRGHVKYHYFKVLNKASLEERDMEESQKSRIQKLYICRRGCYCFNDLSQTKCPKCDKEDLSNREYIWYMSVRPFICHLFSKSEVVESMRETTFNGTDGGIRDVWY